MISTALITETAPFGTSRQEWTVNWWKWFLGDRKQPELSPVFFLPGKWMTRYNKEILNTDNLIPQDKVILTPVDNWLSFGSQRTPDQQLRDTAIERTNNLVYLRVQMDGNEFMNGPVAAMRITSDVFNIDLPSHAQVHDEISGGVIKPGKYKVLSDGYWLFLRPMIRGKHNINLSCSCRTSELSLEICHKIEIV